jgi:hypothetical protein
MDHPDRPRDQPGPPRPRPWSDQDMRARLDRLPPSHPSSPAYRRARDTRRQADQQPEQQHPWYTAHTTREQAIERQRHDQAPSTGPRQWRDQWYSHNHGKTPAPFRQETAALVPTGTQRTKGRLDRHDGGTGLPLESGSRTGLVDALKQHLGHLPEGFTSQSRSHVEAHAAAYLWLNPHIHAATVYVNRPPCPGPKGCRARLPAMLPPRDVTLTLYGPNGFWQVYHGQRTKDGGT